MYYDDDYDDYNDDEPFTYDDIIEPYDPQYNPFAGYDDDPAVGCLFDVRKHNLLHISMDNYGFMNGEVPHIHIGADNARRVASCTLGSGNIRGNLTSREISMLDIWLSEFRNEAIQLYSDVLTYRDDTLYAPYLSGQCNYMGLQFIKRKDYERIYSAQKL